jgi:hypothetical protein
VTRNAIDSRRSEAVLVASDGEEETELPDRVALVSAVSGVVAASTSGLAAGGAPLLGVILGPLVGATLGSGWRQRVALALLGALSWIPPLLWGFDHPFARAAAGAAVGVTLVVAERWRRRRRGLEAGHRAGEASTVALTALAILLVFSEASGPPPVGVTAAVLRALAAGGAGLLVALAMLPLHLRTLRDRVAAALQRLRPLHDTAIQKQLREIVRARRRVLRLLAQSSVDRTTREETRRGLDSLALAAIELAVRFDPVNEVLERFALRGVAERAEQLRAQHAQARDPQVRVELERSLEALAQHQAQLATLDEGRERLLARLGRELVSLERTELSLAVLASGDASLCGLRLGNVGEELARQAEELHDEGLELQTALDELPLRGRVS